MRLWVVIAGLLFAAPNAQAQDRPPPVGALRLLEGEAAAFDLRAQGFRSRIDAVVRGEYQRRRRSIDEGYEPQLRAEERERRAARARAIQALEGFLARYPDDPTHTPDALFRLAELRFEESYDAYLDAADRTDGAEPAKDFTPTITLFRRLIRRWPGYRHIDGAWYLLGYCLAETGRHDEARQAFLALVCATRSGTPAAGAPAGPVVDPFAGCQPVVPDSAFLAEVWLRLGEHHFDLDASPQALPTAISAYRRALAWPESPWFDKALYKLAWSTYRAERYAEAIRHFAMLVDHADARGSELRAEAIQYLALCFAEEDWDGDRRPDAATSLDRVQDPHLLAQDRPWTPEVLLQLADVTLDLAKYPEAVALYETALRRWPRHLQAPHAAERLAIVYERAGDSAAAAAARRRLAAYGAGGAWARANAGHPAELQRAAALAGEAEVDEAIHHHREAQELRRRSVVEADPGALRRAQAAYERAVVVYRAMLDRAPDDPRAYELRHNLADALYWSGQWQEAAEQYALVRDSNFDDGHLVDGALGAVEALERHVAAEVAAGRLAIRQEAPGPEPGSSPPRIAPLPIPDALVRLLAARDAYVRRVGAARDREGRIPALAYDSALVLLRYGHWDEASAALSTLFERYCTTHEVGLYAWQSLVQMADTLRQTDVAERLARAQVSRRCSSAASAGAACGDQTCGADHVCRQGACVPAGELGAEVLVAAQLGRAMDELAAAERSGSPAAYERAARSLVSAVDRAPRHRDAPAALHNAALALERSGRLGAATELRERIVREAPDSEHVDEALFRAALGHARLFELESAIEAYDRLANEPRFRQSAHRPDALRNAAVLLEGLQEYERAARAFDAYAAVAPNEEVAATAAFAAAELTSRRGAWPEAVRRLRALQRRLAAARGGDPTVLVHAGWLLAEALGEERRTSERHAALADTVEAFRRSGAAPGSEPAEYAARARFALAEEGLAAYDRLRISGSGARLRASAQAKLERARALEDAYAEVEALGRPRWAVAARARIGALYDRAAQALLAAPVPPAVARLGPDAVELYRSQVSDSVRPMEARALREYDSAVRAARQAAIESEHVAAALERLGALRPEEHPPLRPGHTVLELDARSPAALPGP